MLRTPIAHTGTLKLARIRKCGVKDCASVEPLTASRFGVPFDLQEQRA